MGPINEDRGDRRPLAAAREQEGNRDVEAFPRSEDEISCQDSPETFDDDADFNQLLRELVEEVRKRVSLRKPDEFEEKDGIRFDRAFGDRD